MGDEICNILDISFAYNHVHLVSFVEISAAPIVVPYEYELYERYDRGKVQEFTELYNGHRTLWNFTNFTLLERSLSSGGQSVVGV